MGNTLCDVKTAAPEGAGTPFLTAKEAQELQVLYGRLFEQSGQQVSIRDGKLAEAFHVAHKSVIMLKLTDLFVKRVKRYEEFEEVVVRVTRQAPKETIRVFWDMLDSADQTTGSVFWTLVIQAAFWEATEPCYGEARFVSRMQEFLQTASLLSGVPTSDGGGHLNFDALIGFVNNYAPHTAKALETFFSMACFRNVLSPSYKPFLSPQLDTPSEIVQPCDILPLALYTEALQGQWKRLYSTSVDGLSFNRLAFHCLGYDGPTCVIIRCQDPDNTIIGAVTYDRWKDSNRFYGSSKNTLFSLSPKLRIYRGKNASNGSYQWLNTKSHTLPNGLGFGGTTEGFRLFIPESLEHCTAVDSCPTYETGPLIDSAAEHQFEIHTLEVWGCGGSDTVASALQAQSRERAQLDENIRKARQVDKAQFFSNEFDREMFLSGTTSHASGKDRLGNA